MNVSSTYTTYPNTILGFTFTFIPQTTDLYTIRIFRNGSQIFQAEDVQNTQLVTESDFTLASGTYTVAIGSTSTMTFNSGNVRFAVNGNLGVLMMVVLLLGMMSGDLQVKQLLVLHLNLE